MHILQRNEICQIWKEAIVKESFTLLKLMSLCFSDSYIN
jgi:hypothetical protein